jgi:hypothetical protein
LKGSYTKLCREKFTCLEWPDQASRFCNVAKSGCKRKDLFAHYGIRLPGFSGTVLQLCKFGTVENPGKAFVVIVFVFFDMCFTYYSPEVFTAQFLKVRCFDKKPDDRIPRFEPDLK